MGFNRYERIFILENYFATKSYLRVQSNFAEKFPGLPAPNKSTIKRLVDRFRINGDVLDQTKNQKRREKDDISIENLRRTNNRINKQKNHPTLTKKSQTIQDDDIITESCSSTPSFDCTYEFMGIENVQEEVNSPVTIVSVRFDEEDNNKEELLTEADHDEKMKQFILEVRKIPSLYATKNEDYKYTDLKQKTWETIAKTCNLPNGVIAQNLWRSLVSDYSVAKTNLSVSNYNNLSTSWKYNSHMSFLDDHLEPNEPSCVKAASDIVDTRRFKSDKPDASSSVLQENSEVVGDTILHYLDEKNGLQDGNDEDLGLKAFFLSAYHSTQKMTQIQQTMIKKKISDILFEAEINS